jgi:hypothetical protein
MRSPWVFESVSVQARSVSRANTPRKRFNLYHRMDDTERGAGTESYLVSSFAHAFSAGFPISEPADFPGLYLP